MTGLRIMMFILVPLVGLSACAKSAHQTGKDLLDEVLPAEVREQIDSTVRFADVKADPSRYVGRMVMFGGIVLGAKRAKDRTEIEVLQLPTDSGGIPSDDRSRSEGRFLAVVSQFLDPATIEPGTPVMVVGEIKGAITQPLDDSEYTYPVIEVSRLIDWNKMMRSKYGRGVPYPYYGGYVGSSFYWGWPYWSYPYYWGPYYPLIFANPTPAPSRPPPSSIPPQFRKRP